MSKNYYDINEWPLPKLIQEFKNKYDRGISGLDGMSMRKILMGDLHKVYTKKNKYTLMTTEELEKAIVEGKIKYKRG